MNILAVEQSTSSASVALVCGDSLTGERKWSETRSRNQQLFEEIPRLLEDTGIGFDDLGAFAAGLGPGSFTSLRIAVSALRAYALPRQTPVVGIPSDAALSLAISEQTGKDRVTVIGDARRERLWIARYSIENGNPILDGSREMIPYPDFQADPERDGIIASPDWDRLQDQIQELSDDSCAVTGPQIPRARNIARLAPAKLSSVDAEAELTPIYLHPPVFVEPRFPEASAPPA